MAPMFIGESFSHCNELRADLQAITWCTIREPSSHPHQCLANSIGFEFFNCTGLNVISVVTINEQLKREENIDVKVYTLSKGSVKTEKHVTSSVQCPQSVI